MLRSYPVLRRYGVPVLVRIRGHCRVGDAVKDEGVVVTLVAHGVGQLEVGRPQVDQRLALRRVVLELENER